MKTLMAVFVLLGLADLVKGAVTWSSITETQFANVSTVDRSWGAQLIEQGTGYELGIGAGNFSSPSASADYLWELGVQTPFTLEYSFAGNLKLSLNNSIPSVVYQPLGQTMEILIGNRNISGAPFQSLTLRNLVLNGVSLPTMSTVGNPISNSEFQGIAINGFPSEFVLTGNIVWASTVGDLAFNGSSAMFMGVNHSTGFVIPEPSVSIFFLVSACALFFKRSRH